MFLENLKASKLHQYCRRKFVPWGKTWRYLSIQEILEMTSMFKNREISYFGFFGTFGRSEKQRKILGKVDYFLDRFISQENKYLSFGILEK